jgi:adenine-specific DNA-methyltransferase
MPGQKKHTEKDIKSYTHDDKQRLNNPPVGLVTPDTDPDTGTNTYSYDPHLDPQLVWAGKAEHTSFEVPTVSLHVHERIDPRTILEAVQKDDDEPAQASLFEQERQTPLRHDIEFYKHKHNWSNRLIAGDSLLVMNSLSEKEGLGGQIQMIYIDPPYGVSYRSNFQPFTDRPNVAPNDKDSDLTAEPEMIKAFRDTWELGIHSYLSYLRDRLLVARDLLSDTGSCFVQISDENLGYVQALMNEVFGPENLMSIISFRTKIPLNAAHLPNTSDYIIWFAKDKSNIKFRRVFTERKIGRNTPFTNVEFPDGTRRKMTKNELDNPDILPSGARAFRVTDLLASGYTESCHYEFEFNGVKCYPPGRNSWKTNPEGMQKLIDANRLTFQGTIPGYVFYADDYPVTELTNQWTDTQGATGKIYAVQTATKVVERCMLMTTEPGDLIFDPTAGSGVSAVVAEEWGRRWIVCDTSRVAIALTKQRLTCATFPYEL